jgi:hypothetical protein
MWFKIVPSGTSNLLKRLRGIVDFGAGNLEKQFSQVLPAENANRKALYAAMG